MSKQFNEVDEIIDEERPPVIPVIIIGPGGNPQPLPPSKPKPPTE
jgi:hypothetical protein